MAATPATAHDEHATTLPTPVRRSGWSLFWGGVGFALLLLMVGLLTLLAIGRWGEGSFTDVDTQREAYRAKVLADRLAEDHKLLYDAPSWFAKDKGLVRVPIDQAVALTMTRLQTEKPHPAYPVSQSPPQPAAAPTSPGVGSSATTGNNAINPPASNPGAGQTAASAPAATPAPSAAPATAKSSPPPTGTTIVGGGAPMPSASPTLAAAPVSTAAPTPATTGAPTPAPTAIPAAPAPTPTPGNNANNPGNPPIPGTAVQPPAPSPTVAPPPSPDGATAQPNNAVPPPPKPSASVSSSPDPNQTTATPAP